MNLFTDSLWIGAAAPLAAWLWALVSALLFALGLIFVRLGLAHLPVMLGASISVPSAALLFWVLAPVMVDGAAWHWGAAGLFAGVGLVYPAIVTFLVFESNRRMGPELSGALGNLTPAFAVAFAALLLGELPGLAQVLALALVVLGATMIGWRPGGGGGWPLWVIVLPLLGAAVRGALQPAIKSGLSLWPSAFAATWISYTISALVVVTIVCLRSGGRPRGYRRPGLPWFVAAGLANGLAVLAMYQALSLGPVVVVAPLVATYPLFTLAMGIFLPDPVRLDSRQILAVALTVAGVVLLLAAPAASSEIALRP